MLNIKYVPIFLLAMYVHHLQSICRYNISKYIKDHGKTLLFIICDFAMLVSYETCMQVSMTSQHLSVRWSNSEAGESHRIHSRQSMDNQQGRGGQMA